MGLVVLALDLVVLDSGFRLVEFGFRWVWALWLFCLCFDCVLRAFGRWLVTLGLLFVCCSV